MKQGFIFPGQGSQTVGMLGDLSSHPIVVEVFNTAQSVLGYDLYQMVCEGPESELNKTVHTQPALLATSIAFWKLYLENDGEMPAMLAGHSLGEYSALVAGNAISLEDGLKLVALRGQLMQDAVPQGEGAMAAILGLTDDQAIQACKDAAQGEVVSAVNFNAPGQVVIAGQTQAVARAIETCKAMGAKRALPLPVSVPSHCALMEGAAEKLAKAMSEMSFSSPNIPLVNNVDARIENDPAAIRDALRRQLYSPVRWVQVIEAMAKQGIEQFVECGPGKVLCGLNKRIVKDIPSQPFDVKEFACN